MSFFEKFNALKTGKLKEAKEKASLFLKENGGLPNIITTASGLQYEILFEGSGMHPDRRDKVECHYHGTLIDGTVFDSSVQRNKTATFPVSKLIKGWTEALQLMKEGSKWRLFVPWELGYGEESMGKIPACSVLIFEVELIKIV
jgi:FKBP-type peptidyl-prolyl cis-trans isomerase